MSIEKIVVVDQITVDEFDNVLIRQATRIVEDEVVISETYHRTSISKNGDLSGQSPKVVAIATSAWSV